MFQSVTTPTTLRFRWPLLLFWVVIIAVTVAAPALLPVFRLNLLGRFLSLAIVALGIDLIWGFTGLLSLGQTPRTRQLFLGGAAEGLAKA